MATKSYSELYLSDVCENIGAMLEYVVRGGCSLETFWRDFVNSDIARQIENGNPKYLSGYSGRDFAEILLGELKVTEKETLSFDQYYWAGWALARLQYETSFSFYEIDNCLPIERVLELYPTLHEADITKFLDVAGTYLKEEKKETNLKKIRTAAGLSQRQLSMASDVDLRSIQMYEQKRNDINKAQAETLLKIARTLGCKIEDLLEK